jgi:uncharacterized LabA/DUF88 family protein
MEKDNKVRKNVVIYVDYENVHKTLLKEHKNLLGMGFFEKLTKWCEENNMRIMDIIVYCNFDLKDLYESNHQTKLQEYGIETVHTSNKGKNFSDLKITADLLEQMHTNNNIDGFILISNDKDMTPVIKAVKKYKEFIYLIVCGNEYDKSLLNFPDKIINIDNIEKILITEDLEIEKYYKSIYNNLHEYLIIKHKDYITNNKNIVHHGLDFYINKSFSHFNIMKYEFANIIKQLVEEEAMMVYNYKYYDSRMKCDQTGVAILTSELKQIYIDGNIITESNIIANYDFDAMINKLYESYIKIVDKN